MGLAMCLKGLPFHVLRIEHHQLSAQTAAHATQNFECLGGLQTANHTHQWRQHAHGGASGFFKILSRRKHTGIAR